MLKKIHWGALATAAVGLIAGGKLVEILPEKYKPIASGLAIIVSALAPSIVQSSNSTDPSK